MLDTWFYLGGLARNGGWKGAKPSISGYLGGERIEGRDYEHDEERPTEDRTR